jgi:hypothetical protein
MHLITTPPLHRGMSEAGDNAGNLRRRWSRDRREIPGAAAVIPRNATAVGAHVGFPRRADHGEDRAENRGRRAEDGKQLVQQLDRVAFPDHSFRKHGGVNTDFAVVGLRDVLQNRGSFFRAVGIECDHHAS